MGDDGDGFGRIRARQHPVELGVELGLGGIGRDHLGRLVWLQLLRLTKQGEATEAAEIEPGGTRSLAGRDRWLPGLALGGLSQTE
ncbi:hypothetical protein D3C78_1834260 [compost metagenome]